MLGGLVLDGDRALIFDRVTGEVIRCAVPTALENVANGGGRFVHGTSGEPLSAPSAGAAPEPVISLSEEDVLPLPAGDRAAAAEPAAPEPAAPAAAEPAKPDPLDHDGDGKKGGARKPADPERAAIIKALKAANIKFFAGASTAKLKALLPA